MESDEFSAKVNAEGNRDIIVGLCAILLFITGILLTLVLRPTNPWWVILGVIDIILSVLVVYSIGELRTEL